MKRTFWRLLPAGLALAALLGGCTPASDPELAQWMAQQKRQLRLGVVPLAVAAGYVAENYDPAVGLDPFSVQKMTQALSRETVVSAASKALIAPELQRPKEPLEAMPLDSMVMVGSLVKAGQVVGLLKVNQLLYPVRVGNYLGLNYGRITRLDEKSISVREVVATLDGGWMENQVTLLLQEKTK